MSCGDEEGLYVCPGSQDGADYFILVGERRITSLFCGRRLEFADESAFCAADGRFVQEQSQVGGESQAARMGDSLAVDEEDVGGDFEPFCRLDADGSFAERQQARYVGKADFCDGADGFNDFQCLVFKNDYYCADSGFVLAEGAVDAGDGFRGPFDRR